MRKGKEKLMEILILIQMAMQRDSVKQRD